MAIDRERRDALAETLADFLNGRRPPDATAERFLAVEEREPSADDPAVGLFRALFPSMYKGRLPRRLDADTWHRAGRLIAFWKSDREYVPPPMPPGRPVDGDINGAACRRHLVALALAAACGWAFGTWLPLAVVWVGSFVAFVCLGNVRAWREDRRWRAENPDPWPWFPFARERDWHADRHRLGEFGLPPYDPDLHDPPGTAREALLRHAGAAAFWVAMATMFLSLSLGALPLWPLFLLFGSFRRDGTTT